MMAFLEWRKFNFFDLHKDADNGKIAETLQETEVSAVTSGNAALVVCDTMGWAHLVSRAWSVTSFKAYEATVNLATQLQHEPFLVTVGEEEAGGTPVLKVWDWSRMDRHGNPTCVRSSRVIADRPAPATALAVHHNKKLIAVGLESGAVVALRGDMTRERASRPRALPDTTPTAVTGLAFSPEGHLFVASRSAVMLYFMGASGGGERGAAVDAGGGGAAVDCSVLADQHFMVARADAIYCYTAEGRGPCYALEGDKRRIDWCRGYLLITTVERDKHHLTLLDIHNRFIVFSQTLEESVRAVVAEWGNIYLLTDSKRLLQLEERELQAKLGVLFKRNLYDVAIRIASQHYDADTLAEIYTDYGDRLYAKGDLKGAIEQYMKTIGRLETSHVIRKYLHSRHTEPLMLYLQEVHRKGLATEHHTTLLLTCLVKLDRRDRLAKLDEFVADDANHDVAQAIKVVRQASPADALVLAKRRRRHDLALRILTEDLKDPPGALRYLGDLGAPEAAAHLERHGRALARALPAETAELLAKLCDEQPGDGDGVEPDRFLHLLLHDSRALANLLERAVARRADRSRRVYNTLLEHLVRLWAESEGEARRDLAERALRVLRAETADYDGEQALLVCRRFDFRPGLLFLLEKNRLWRTQMELEAAAHETSEAPAEAPGALEVCRRRGQLCPELWAELLNSAPPPHHLPEVLDNVARWRLATPAETLSLLAAAGVYALGDVRAYVESAVRGEWETGAGARAAAERLKQETESMRAETLAAQTEPLVFQNSRCTACTQLLELPAVHFLCRHSFHKHCYQSVASDEADGCPACEPPPPRPDRAAPADFLRRLREAHDKYAVVSEYLGRGLFNKLTVVTDAPRPAPASTPATAVVTAPPAPAGAVEGRLRLQEGRARSPDKARVPTEGRMRLAEPRGQLPRELAHRDVLQATARPTRPDHAKTPSTRTGHVAAGSPSNPFGDDYDDTKNPFAAEDETDSTPKTIPAAPKTIPTAAPKTIPTSPKSTPAASSSARRPPNPFDEPDYDDNLNPFAD